MKYLKAIKVGFILLALNVAAPAQREQEEVPLMRPDELKTVEEQSEAFNEALLPVINEASKSTVRLWGRTGRRGKAKLLAYGTVVGNGAQVLTKWSEVEQAVDTLQVQTGNNESFRTEVAGVFTEEDLVLLNLGDGGRVDQDGPDFGVLNTRPSDINLKPAKFFESTLTYGQFLTAPQPSGKPGAFGVVSVLERNLRDTDQAHVGIMVDPEYRGEGVRIASVQPEYGAAKAGLQAGDLILGIDDRDISGLQELKNALTNKQPGDKVTMRIETAGKERVVEVSLSNRPVIGQFSFDRLNTMERMGGEPNRVRDGFSKVVQSDMQISKNQVGGPVVDLKGRIVGITIARADRTRTYIMGSRTVMDVLKGDFDTVAVAKTKSDIKRQELDNQRLAMIPKVNPGEKPKDADRMKRHLSDVERLMCRMNRELGALEAEQAP